MFGRTPSGRQPELAYDQILQTLVGFDLVFADLRSAGLPAGTRAALEGFCDDPQAQVLRAVLGPTPPDWPDMQDALVALAEGRREAGNLLAWRAVAEKSEDLAASEPIAGALAALYALMAWMGTLGDKLHFQPWTGHHPGWHVFPLCLSRNLVKAGAIWTARLVAEQAMLFVEAAKDAPFSDQLRAVLTEYRRSAAQAERLYEDAVQDLAWDLRGACDPARPNFRAEIAALFWTLGRVPFAHLMQGARAPAYIPPLSLLRDVVDESMRRMALDPLQQYLWLALKDRPPFDLRSHRILFGTINARFTRTKLHMFAQLLPDDPCRLFAKVATARFNGAPAEPDIAELASAAELVAPVLMEEDPSAYVRLRGLQNLIAEPSEMRRKNWLHLAHVAATGLRGATKLGIFEPFDQTLDIPFYYLHEAGQPDIGETFDWIETYRAANLWYWLAIVPPRRAAAEPEDPALAAEEQRLLRVLRGAWFVTLLPYLPKHYQRHGTNLAEQLDPPAEGERATPSRERYPFDEGLARAEMAQTWRRLRGLFKEMAATSPRYAAQRLRPECDWAGFDAALSAHRR